MSLSSMINSTFFSQQWYCERSWLTFCASSEQHDPRQPFAFSSCSVEADRGNWLACDCMSACVWWCEWSVMWSPIMTPVRLSAPSGCELVTESECVIWCILASWDGPLLGDSFVTTTEGVRTRLGLKMAAISLSRFAFSSFCITIILHVVEIPSVECVWV